MDYGAVLHGSGHAATSHGNIPKRICLRWFNQPPTLSRIQAPNIRMLEVGADSPFVGLEPTAKLYRRNLRIFANLTRIAEPGDRILIIYGASHAHFFRDFIASPPRMTVVDPLDYL